MAIFNVLLINKIKKKSSNKYFDIIYSDKNKVDKLKFPRMKHVSRF